MEDKIRDLWLETDISQAEIAALCEVTPSYVYRVVKENFTVEQRISKKSRVQRKMQTEVRVSPPSWYTGPGRSVPLKIIDYCIQEDLTEIPPGMSIVKNAMGYLVMIPTKALKTLNELYTLRESSRYED